MSPSVSRSSGRLNISRTGSDKVIARSSMARTSHSPGTRDLQVLKSPSQYLRHTSRTWDFVAKTPAALCSFHLFLMTSSSR